MYEQRTAMQFFHWDKSFQTGNRVIDEQHEQLVKIINQFGELLSRNVSRKKDIKQVCSDLLDYANYHFDEEEQLMSKAGLDQRHLMQHHQQHQDLRQEILPLHQLVEVGDLEAGKYMFEFLVNWLVFHILGTDMLMAKQVDGVNQGRSPEEVYLDIEKNNQHSTGQLLAAVKKLLYQISARNKQLLELNETLELKVNERTRELSQANKKLQELASTDSLTGVLNRRAFMEEARNMFDLAKRYQRPLSLLMLDVDHFKRVNDTYGHQTGDFVLTRLSAVMKDSLRSTDIISRIGGEEFAIVLPETDLDKTIELTERLLHTIRNTEMKDDLERPFKITASIGVATVPPVASGLEEVMKEADNALYKAKTEGRDRCCGSLICK
jgi:hemerythrin